MENNNYNQQDQQEDEYSYHYSYRDAERPGPGPSTPPPRQTFSGGTDIFSWVLDAIVLIFAPPVGLVLTVLHAFGTDLFGKLLSSLSAGKTSARPASARTTAPYTRHSAAQRVGRKNGSSAREDAVPPEDEAPKATVKPVESGATVKNVFGWILAVFGFLFAFSAQGALWSVLAGICTVLGGGAMIFSALRSRRKAGAFARCLKVSGSRGIVDMKKLAGTLGVKLTDLDRELTEMIDRGYYGPRAYIDHQRMLLVIDPEDMRDIYRREDEEKQTAARQSEDANMTEYERIIAQIRQADIDIEDEVMSEKIRRMQTLTTAIFKEVEAHPEKRSQITRFMNYYLPTTLKLLNSYARIEAQGVSGENMAKAKADIEGIADTLVAGYEKQLDKLYSAEAIDIAGDVSVIEKMMSSDNLRQSTAPFGGAAAGKTTGGQGT